MTTTVRHLPEQSRYEVFLDEERVGLLDYTQSAGRISYTHTEVDPEFGGRGIARELVRHALDDALAADADVLPVCPYVAKVIRDDPDRYLALVPESERPRFDL